MHKTSAVSAPIASGPTPVRPRALRASGAVASALRQLISEHGEQAAIATCGLARSTVSRLVAEMPVQPATLIAAAVALHVDLAGTVGE
jgi:hypothetical protein